MSRDPTFLSNLDARRNKKGDNHQAMKTRFRILQAIPDQNRKKMAVMNRNWPGTVLLNSLYLVLHCTTCDLLRLGIKRSSALLNYNNMLHS